MRRLYRARADEGVQLRGTGPSCNVMCAPKRAKGLTAHSNPLWPACPANLIWGRDPGRRLPSYDRRGQREGLLSKAAGRQEARVPGAPGAWGSGCGSHCCVRRNSVHPEGGTRGPSKGHRLWPAKLCLEKTDILQGNLLSWKNKSYQCSG